MYKTMYLSNYVKQQAVFIYSKLNKDCLWDTLEMDWEEVTVTFNGNKTDLPKVVKVKLQDKN